MLCVSGEEEKRAGDDAGDRRKLKGSCKHSLLWCDGCLEDDARVMVNEIQTRRVRVIMRGVLRARVELKLM